MDMYNYESFLRAQAELPVPDKSEIEIPQTSIFSLYTDEVFAHFYLKVLETKQKPTPTTFHRNPNWFRDKCNEALPELRNALYESHQRRGILNGGSRYQPNGECISTGNVHTFSNLFSFWKYGPAPGNRIDSVDDLVKVLSEEHYRHVAEVKGATFLIYDLMLSCFLYGIIQADKRIQNNDLGVNIELDEETGLWKAGFFNADFQGISDKEYKNCVKKGSSQFDEQVTRFIKICKE